MSAFKNYRIFMFSVMVAAVLVLFKYLLHQNDWEPFEPSSLHNSVISGAVFVIGFLLSATIADYKESERIPSEFSSILENVYEDAKAVHKIYPGFDLDAVRMQLIAIGTDFKKDVRNKSHEARHEVHKLNDSFVAMERAGVPPNYITKMKQQQAQLGRSLFRVNYIQNINLIPSATIMARAIVIFSCLILLLTQVTPFYGGLAIVAIITFIFVYVLLLIQVISTPFHAAGKTRDDVSLFLVSEATSYLKRQKPVKATKKK